MDPVPPWVLDRQSRLERQRLDGEYGANMENEGHCVVCLDALAVPCQLLPCGHRNFHYACVHLWLLESPSRMCPICKASVSRAVHGPADGQQTHEYGPLDMTLVPPARPNMPPERAVQPPLNTAPQFGRARARPRRTRADRVEPAGLAFRRDVYRHLRYSMHVGSNPVSRYRELMRDSFRHNEELQRRARTFLRRDLRVFSWLTTPDVDNIMPHAGESPQSFQDRRRATTVERLLGHILWLLQHFELRGSDGSVEEVVTTHLGRENTRLLLHELHSFLRSPYLTLEDWDRAVQYPDSSQSRSVGFDEIGGPGPLTGHRAADQRSAPNRFRGRDRQRRGPELARAGPGRLNAFASRSRWGSARDPYFDATPGDSSLRSPGSGVQVDDAPRQRQDHGEEAPPRLASSVVNLRGPTKR